MNGLIQSKKQLDKIEAEKALQTKVDERFMLMAIEQAKIAYEEGEVPVGAVIVKNNEIIAVGSNRKESHNCALYHAEICAIKEASEKLGWRLDGCTMYVTVEPCAMCAGAIVSARISRLVFGVKEDKSGYCVSRGNLLDESGLNFKTKMSEGVLESDCAKLLGDFFASRRKREK